VFGGLPAPAAADSPEMNPCAAKSLNPCAAKKNPCAGKNVCNPCAGKNPCGAAGAAVNPCRFKQPKSSKMGGGDEAALLERGEALWKDTSLSSNGVACATCHAQGASFMPTFSKPYPHSVAMVKQMSGVDAVNASEMVQFCMLQPMQAEPLPWNSPKLAALTYYVGHVQQGHSANPCTMKNPCAAKNPCAGKR
jgi:cytochrome c peroxidase